jgi:hypothetical protein
VAFVSGVVGLEGAALLLWPHGYHAEELTLGAVLFLGPAVFVADRARRGILDRATAGWIAFAFACVLASLLANVMAHAQAGHPKFLHDVNWPVTSFLVDRVGWLVVIFSGIILFSGIMDIFVMMFAFMLADAIDLAAVPLALIVGATLGLAIGQLLGRLVTTTTCSRAGRP